MTPRSRWLSAGIVAIVVVLLLGRWLAVGTADRLWAEALGVADTHAAIARMRTLLFLSTFAVAALSDGYFGISSSTTLESSTGGGSMSVEVRKGRA